MLNKKVEEILNAQIEKEGYSSNLYLAMACWAETSGYKGIADWLYAQAEEERMHMLKFVKYINERGGKTIVSSLDKPPVDFKDVKAMFNQVMEHERMITDSINEIVGVCYDERDFNTVSWIQWFVNEQVEEEASVSEIIDKLNLLGKDTLYLFDRDIMSLRNAASAGAGE